MQKINANLCTSDVNYNPKTAKKSILDRRKCWTRGQVIGVSFIDIKPEIVQKLKVYIKEIESHSQVKFVFLTGEKKGVIRISMNKFASNWSAIGKDALLIKDKSKPTMNLSTVSELGLQLKRRTYHLFGHALGAIHEHKVVSNGINIAEEISRLKVISYAARMANIDLSAYNAVLKVLDLYKTNTSNYLPTRPRPNSVMMPPVPSGFIDGSPVRGHTGSTVNDGIPDRKWNNDLSENDKTFFKTLYALEDQYLVGDWDGDGIDELATRQDNKITFYHQPRLGQESEVTTLLFGRVSNRFEYFVGDFDKSRPGDEIAYRNGNLFVFNYAKGKRNFKLRFGNGDKEIQYLVGDFDANGRDDIAFVRQGADGRGEIHRNIDLETNRTWITDERLRFKFGRGAEEDEYLVGNWDGGQWVTGGTDSRPSGAGDNIAYRRGSSISQDLEWGLVRRFQVFSGTPNEVDTSTNFGEGNNEDQYLLGKWNGGHTSHLAVRRGNVITTSTGLVYEIGEGTYDDKKGAL